ncbi:unnamed protein product [Leptidea sinapis]|uniref:Uncharacterized protein n=1 Tax=Leptidea sinapis TaxID=189913 RepID=A0A5E4QA90_9NEOP|nr:unnamed protein product [Leptidea sinapis]
MRRACEVAVGIFLYIHPNMRLKLIEVDVTPLKKYVQHNVLTSKSLVYQEIKRFFNELFCAKRYSYVRV